MHPAATKDYTLPLLHLSNVTRWASLLAFLVLLFPALGEATATSSLMAPTLVAGGNPRCNNLVAGALERRVRDYDRHPPEVSPDAMSQRYVALNALLQQAQVEHDILTELCSSGTRFPPNEQLAGVIAWGYALESDIAYKRFTMLKCPATATTAAQALLAYAWYALATTVASPASPSPTPTPAPLVAEVMPKIEARARALAFRLPGFGDATQYWRDEVNGRVAACPTPVP
jgi:hypothetical protein